MSPNVDASDYKVTPMDISKAIGNLKVSNVVVEVFDDDHKWWDRYSNGNLDSLMTMLFGLSMSYDIIGIQTIRNYNLIYISLKSSKRHSSNIDQEMMDAISRIEFDGTGG